ncbi:hypothetical protein ACSQ67_020001 [Phaseolus vulgaris]
MASKKSLIEEVHSWGWLKQTGVSHSAELWLVVNSVMYFFPIYGALGSVFIGFGGYVPAHLHLKVFELVKNSLRAVQERFMDSDKVAPPIRIIVADGIEDVTIKYRNPLDEHSHLGIGENVTMAGYGYGLLISRLYARYFGGDLQMISMEGYGTGAHLHLSSLGDSQEPKLF